MARQATKPEPNSEVAGVVQQTNDRGNNGGLKVNDEWFNISKFCTDEKPQQGDSVILQVGDDSGFVNSITIIGSQQPAKATRRSAAKTDNGKPEPGDDSPATSSRATRYGNDPEQTERIIKGNALNASAASYSGAAEVTTDLILARAEEFRAWLKGDQAKDLPF